MSSPADIIVEGNPRLSQLLPPELARGLAPHLQATCEEICAAISVQFGGYGAEPVVADAVFRGASDALHGFLAEIETGSPRRRSRLFFRFGQHHLLAGRELEELMAAYRIATRLAWLRLGAAAQGLVDDAVIVQLGGAIMAFSEELAAETAAGYASEQTELASGLALRRRRLATLLLRSEPVDPAVLELAARAAGVRLPDSVVALVVSPGDWPRLSARVAGDVPVGPDGDLVCALLDGVDAEARLPALRKALAGGALAVLGPAVPVARARASFEPAASVLRVLRARGEPPAGVVRAYDHLPELLVGNDRGMAEAIARARLAPLDDLEAASRRRLLSTLAEWLRHDGRLTPAARSLRVHPQTVRYRLAQLRDLFGAALDDPDARFDLAVAVRLHRVLEDGDTAAAAGTGTGSGVAAVAGASNGAVSP